MNRIPLGPVAVSVVTIAAVFASPVAAFAITGTYVSKANIDTTSETVTAGNTADYGANAVDVQYENDSGANVNCSATAALNWTGGQPAGTTVTFDAANSNPTFAFPYGDPDSGQGLGTPKHSDMTIGTTAGVTPAGTYTFTMTATPYRSTSYKFQGVTESTANCSTAESPTSTQTGTLVVNPLNQSTLTVTGLPSSATYQQAGITAGTSGGSGSGAVTFSAGASTACSVDSSTGAVSITSGTGSCIITATKAQDSFYNSATSAGVSIAVGKVSQTFNFATLPDQTFGAPDFTVSASSNSTGTTGFTGFGSCWTNGDTVHLFAIGGCTISATNPGDTNYDAAGPLSQSFNVNPSTTVVYDAIPSAFPGNVASEGFESDSISQFGDYIHLAGTDRLLNTVSVMMSDWALQATPANVTFCTNNPSDCTSTGYTWPITINIYSNHLNANGVPDTLLAIQTENVFIPWRPVADPTCSTPTAWRDPANNTCYNGLAFDATFDLSNLDVILPSDVIVGVAYNTETYGASPVGIDGPYDSLNVGVNANQAVSVGTDDSADSVFVNSSWAGAYNSAGTTGIFREDSGWTPYGTVNLELTASPVTTSANTTVVQSGDLATSLTDAVTNPSKWWFFNEETNALDNTLGSFVTGPATAPLGNGSAQIGVSSNSQSTSLATLGFEGTPLNKITSLSYSTYRSAGDPALALALQFDVTNGTGVPSGYQGRLVYEPYYTHTVDDNTWQTWNPMDDSTSGGLGNWWFSNSTLASESGCSISTPCTWAQVLVAFPNIGISGGTYFKAGSGWDTFTGNVDDFAIGIQSGSNINTTTFDFEPDTTPPSVPVLLTPPNGSATTTNDFYFTWNPSTDNEPGTITYEYLASMNPAVDGNGMLTTNTWDSITNGNETLTSPQILSQGAPDGTWYWEVRAEDVSGNESAWSPVWSLVIDTQPVTTDPASSVVDTDATLNGSNGPAAADDTSFWWGTTPESGTPFTSAVDPSSQIPSDWNHDSGLGTAGAGVSFDEPLASLTPGTTYYFVAWSQIGGTWYPGAVQSFTTTGSAPTASVITDAATDVDLTDGTLQGQNGAIAASDTSFWWGTTPESGSPFTAAADPSSELPSDWSHDSGLGTAAVNGSFDEPLSGLDANTTYYFAAWSEVGGIWYPGAVENFTTAAPANVETDAATNVTPSDAQLNGEVGPSDASQVSFWISTTPGIDTSNPNSIPSGVVSTPVTNNISANTAFSDELSIATTGGIPSNLPTIQPNTTYYYVAWANVGGTWYPGAQQSFETLDGPTPGTPGVTTDAATSVSDTDATLTGTNGGVDADAESFWVSTDSSFDVSDPNTIPADAVSTQVITVPASIAAGGTFTASLSSVTNNGIPADQDLSAITPSTNYYYVAWSHVNGTWYHGDIQTITTSAAPVVPAPTADDQTLIAGENQPLDITLTDSGSGDSFSVVGNPSNGTLSGTGADLTYTPNADFTGDDSFTFRSNNGSDSNVATVSITVVGPPVLAVTGNNPAYVIEGSSYIDNGATITGPAADTALGVSASVDGGTTSTDPVSINTSTPGTHTIVYSVTDSFGNTGSVTRTVDVLASPTATLTSSSAVDPSTTSDNPILVTATFSEPIENFTEASITTTNGAIVSNVATSSDNTSATFDVTPATNGTILVTVAPGSFKDYAGDPNTDTESLTFDYTAATSDTDLVTSGGSGGSGSGGSNGAPVVSYSPYDLNHDGKVNLLDFNILISNWGKTGANIPGDFNGDGVVNLLDLNMFLIHWLA